LKFHFAQQILEAWVGAQWVKSRVNLKEPKQKGVFVVGLNDSRPQAQLRVRNSPAISHGVASEAIAE
jgi:hypothetical protein